MKNQPFRINLDSRFFKNLKTCCIFILIPLLILWGCTKLTLKDNNPPLPENWAKEWYYAEFRKSTAYKTSKIQHHPDWKHGRHQTLGNYTISEFPLVSSVRTSPITYANISLNDKKRISDATFERLLVGIGPNKKTQVRVLTYIPELAYLERHNFDASDNKITAIADDFEGLILVHEWDGKFVTGFNFKNGKRRTKVSYKLSTDLANDQMKTITNGKKNESKKDDKVIVNACILTWTDVYKTYWSGHYEGDDFIEDDRWTVYAGVSDVQLVGDCGEQHEEEFKPIDPCDLFPCDDGSGGGTQTPPDPTCPNNLQVTPTIQSGAFPTLDITTTSGVWGLTMPEDVEVNFYACKEGSYYRAVVTAVIGNYSQQTRLLPGVSEVMGPGANTTSVNYCTQMLNLDALGNFNPPEWYMLSAVQAHEQVHADHFLPGLSSVVNVISYSINVLTVPYTGQPAAIAEDQIRSLPAFQTALSTAHVMWLAQTTILVANDHLTKTPQAEHNIVDPMISLICSFAMGNNWASCFNICY